MRIHNNKAISLTLLMCAIALAIAFVLHPHSAKAASTYTVDSIGDEADDNPGDLACHTALDTCTLRAAIQEVNAGAGGDTINFGIAGTGVHTLTPASAYPNISKSVTIDGYSQPGAVANTAVAPAALNGTLTIEIFGAGGSYSGLNIGANDVTIKGLSIINFLIDGIYSDGTNTAVYGNYLTENGVGIVLSGLADSSAIGSVNPADRNLVSSNINKGISLSNGNSQSSIKGNYIGVAVNGTTAMANKEDAIDIQSNQTTIGGTELSAINVISGNLGAGISFKDSSAFNTVQGNYIGVDRTGIAPLGNEGFGVGLQGIQNTIGGSTQASRNIIAGNLFNQLILFNSNDSIIQGNYIGTDKDGSLLTNPPNSAGIMIANSSNNNIVGGTGTGEVNKIAYNTTSGVVVISIAGLGPDPLNNSIIGNDIEQNTGSGIRLCNDTNTDFQCDTPEPYPNDAGDPDVGPNMFMNFPVINSATKGTGQVTVNYDLDINPAEVGATGYSVDFYANSTNAREGAVYLGSDIVPGSVAGQSATLTLPGSVPADYYVTAVTTMTDVSSDGYGHSSEFSAAVQAIAASPTPGPTPTPSPSETSSSSLANTGQPQHTNQRLFIALALIAAGVLGIACLTTQRLYSKKKRKSRV